MWKQKLGMSLSNQYSVPTPDAVRMLAKAGFEAISPVWSGKVDLEPTIQTARECGLVLQSLHAPFHLVNRLWNADETLSEPAMQELFRSLEDCRRWEIPVWVTHAWIGFGDEVGDVPSGLKNYGKLVERAAEYGIRVAIENTEGLQYLEILMEHFKENPTVGFCWDS